MPFRLTKVSEVWIACCVARTCAPVKFLPRTRSRTGLIVWPAHQDGGSTLVTEGESEFVEAKTTQAQTNKQINTLRNWKISVRMQLLPLFLRAKVFPSNVCSLRLRGWWREFTCGVPARSIPAVFSFLFERLKNRQFAVSIGFSFQARVGRKQLVMNPRISLRQGRSALENW